MSEFKKGDWVRVYGHIRNDGDQGSYMRGDFAVVTSITAKDEINVRISGYSKVHEVHPKQCRPAKPAKKAK